MVKRGERDDRRRIERSAHLHRRQGAAQHDGDFPAGRLDAGAVADRGHQGLAASQRGQAVRAVQSDARGAGKSPGDRLVAAQTCRPGRDASARLDRVFPIDYDYIEKNTRQLKAKLRRFFSSCCSPGRPPSDCIRTPCKRTERGTIRVEDARIMLHKVGRVAVRLLLHASDAHHLELEFRIAQARRRPAAGTPRSSASTSASVSAMSTAAAFCFQILAALGAGDRHDAVALRQQPGERDLRHGGALAVRDRLERPEQVEVLLEIAFLEARMRVTAVGFDQVAAALRTCR